MSGGELTRQQSPSRLLGLTQTHSKPLLPRHIFLSFKVFGAFGCTYKNCKLVRRGKTYSYLIARALSREILSLQQIRAKRRYKSGFGQARRLKHVCMRKSIEEGRIAYFFALLDCYADCIAKHAPLFQRKHAPQPRWGCGRYNQVYLI